MEETARKFIEKLQADSSTLGIILFGSRARGNNRPDSDYDLLVIVKEGFKKVVERRDGITFEMIFTTEKDCASYWQKSKDDCVDLWQVAKILFNRDGTVQRLKVIADQIKEAGKDPINAEDLAIARFEIFDQFKAIHNLAGSDPTTTNMLLANHVLHLTAIFFNLRQQWTPPPKQRLVVIQSINPDFYGQLMDFFAGNPLVRQIALVEEMAKLVFEAGN